MTHMKNIKPLYQPLLLHIEGNENHVLQASEKHIK